MLFTITFIHVYLSPLFVKSNITEHRDPEMIKIKVMGSYY